MRCRQYVPAQGVWDSNLIALRRAGAQTAGASTSCRNTTDPMRLHGREPHPNRQNESQTYAVLLQLGPMATTKPSRKQRGLDCERPVVTQPPTRDDTPQRMQPSVSSAARLPMPTILSMDSTALSRSKANLIRTTPSSREPVVSRSFGKSSSGGPLSAPIARFGRDGSSLLQDNASHQSGVPHDTITRSKRVCAVQRAGDFTCAEITHSPRAIPRADWHARLCSHGFRMLRA